MLDILLTHGLSLAELLAPVLVGIFTVPVLRTITHMSTYLDGLAPWAKQIAAVLVAYFLTLLAHWLQTPLPDDLQLFTGEHIQAALSAGIALAVHAGQKASKL